jgi:hypothetical protein
MLTGMRAYVLAALAPLLVAVPARATHLPRLKLKPGMTQAQAIRQVNRKIDRAAGFSNADCWLYQGNARIGWRHGACVGTYNYAETPYRFKLIETPISCSRERIVLSARGLKTQITGVPWKHTTFIWG